MIGTPVTVNVSAGAAAAAYALPAGTGAGTYIIQATYNANADYGGSSDSSHLLTITAAATATAAASASVTFNESAQNVSLTATVTSAAGVVDEGTETFTVLLGSTVLGTPVTVSVSAGAAAANYLLPGGIGIGTYTIRATYNGTDNFLSFTDTSHSLIVGSVASATAAANASVIFNGAIQDVPLTATVTSAAGVVDEGTETFTILFGSTAIGVPVTVNVSAGAASVLYALPAGTPAATYTIQAVYNGTPNFGGSSDKTHNLVVGAAGTATAAASVSIPFSETGQSVPLSATIGSDAGAVDEGAVTFSVLNNGVAVGSPVTFSVRNGVASGDYPLPAGTPTGLYIIQAAYTGTSNFAGSTDSTHGLTVGAADTTTTTSNASIPFDESEQLVPLTATVGSGAGTVDEGTVTFTLRINASPVGTPLTVPVQNGVASGNYVLPAGTPADATRSRPLMADPPTSPARAIPATP